VYSFFLSFFFIPMSAAAPAAAAPPKANAAVLSSIAAGEGKPTNHVTTHNAADESKARDMTLAALNKDQTGRLKKSSQVHDGAAEAGARDMTLATINRDQHGRLNKTSQGLAEIERKNQEAVKAGVASEKASK